MSNETDEESWLRGAIERAEASDPELHRLKLAVEVTGEALGTASDTDRGEKQDAYRTAMRQLLNYLNTPQSSQP